MRYSLILLFSWEYTRSELCHFILTSTRNSRSCILNMDYNGTMCTIYVNYTHMVDTCARNCNFRSETCPGLGLENLISVLIGTPIPEWRTSQFKHFSMVLYVTSKVLLLSIFLLKLERSGNCIRHIATINYQAKLFNNVMFIG